MNNVTRDKIVVVVASVALSSFSAARRERTWCNDKKKKSKRRLTATATRVELPVKPAAACAENGHKLEYEAIGGSWLRAEQRE
jgi:hypothetical protein